MTDTVPESLIQDVANILNGFDIPFLMIGARARIFAFDQPFNIQGRATRDWDFAIRLDEWSGYEALIQAMTEGDDARFRKTTIHHRLIHQSTEIEVDIVPFGNISDSQQLIQWPQDNNTMSVLGLEEAWANAEVEEIAGIQMRLPPLPVIVALKLLAWNERREEKDLDDVVTILQNYQNDERVFAELTDEMIAGVVEMAAIAIVLIGRDIQQLFQNSPALDEVRAIVETLIKEQNQHFPRFIASGDEIWDDAFDLLVQQFQALRYGLVEADCGEVPTDE